MSDICVRCNKRCTGIWIDLDDFQGSLPAGFGTDTVNEEFVLCKSCFVVVFDFLKNDVDLKDIDPAQKPEDLTKELWTKVYAITLDSLPRLEDAHVTNPNFIEIALKFRKEFCTRDADNALQAYREKFRL